MFCDKTDVPTQKVKTIRQLSSKGIRCKGLHAIERPGTVKGMEKVLISTMLNFESSNCIDWKQ
jgi:hypothetical protein